MTDQPNRRDWSARDIRAMLILARAGMNASEIGRELDRHPHTIRRALRVRGVETDHRGKWARQ